MIRRPLQSCFLAALLFSLVCGMDASTHSAVAGEWEITENFGPVQVGFSLLRRFGWWDDGHVNGTAGATTHNEPPSVFTPNAQVITGAMSLPDNFPVDLVAPIDGTGAVYEVLYSRPAFYYPNATTARAGDFDNNGIVDAYDFIGWQRGNSPSPGSATDLMNWQENYALNDGFHKQDTGSDNLVELSLANTDAANFAGYSDVSMFDNADPNVRGTAMLQFDYRLTYVDPAPDVVVPIGPPFPPQPFTHPKNDHPYDVPTAHDVPVEIRFGLLYLDQDTTPNPVASCSSFGGGNNCWHYVAASGTDFSVVDDSADTFNQIIDDGDSQFFELIADGEVHTAQIPMTFLTAAERLAEQWMDHQQGLNDPANPFWNNPDIVDNLRWATRGGAPHLLVIDNIKLSAMPAAANTAVPEPASLALVLVSALSLINTRRRC